VVPVNLGTGKKRSSLFLFLEKRDNIGLQSTTFYPKLLVAKRPNSTTEFYISLYGHSIQLFCKNKELGEVPCSILTCDVMLLRSQNVVESHSFCNILEIYFESINDST
jgi:hypothetical protein